MLIKKEGEPVFEHEDIDTKKLLDVSEIVKEQEVAYQRLSHLALFEIKDDETNPQVFLETQGELKRLLLLWEEKYSLVLASTKRPSLGWETASDYSGLTKWADLSLGQEGSIHLTYRGKQSFTLFRSVIELVILSHNEKVKFSSEYIDKDEKHLRDDYARYFFWTNKIIGNRRQRGCKTEITIEEGLVHVSNFHLGQQDAHFGDIISYERITANGLKTSVFANQESVPTRSGQKAKFDLRVRRSMNGAFLPGFLAKIMK